MGKASGTPFMVCDETLQATPLDLRPPLLDFIFYFLRAYIVGLLLYLRAD